MKLNKISMMLAAAALVGCSDDFSERFTGQAIDDSRLIQLDANFVLGGVGDEGATTRTHWEQIGSTNSFQNVFLPTLTTAGTSGSNLVTACGAQGDEVGLCWLGQGAPTSEVYTNYQFAHAGWLYTNQKAPQISCNELENGIWYKETELNASVAAGKEVQALQLRGTTVSGKSAAKFVLDPNSPTDKDVNLNSGVYKTENKAIFGGDYIVYYPFNENFNEKGTIPAVAVTQFGDGTSTSAPTSLDDPALAEATFRYSDPVTIKGGDQAAGFKMHNLSTLVRLKVSTVAVGGIATSDKIDQIVLCSREGQLLAQANLAANLIVGGEKSGTELYAERKYIKTIVANFKSGDELTDIDSNTPKDAYVTVLPTTVENLKVLVHKTDGTSGKWATVVIGEKKFDLYGWI